MAEGIAIERHGQRTWLKWHRARKQAGDVAFSGTRILEGMRLGASVEVDLRRHAHGGFAVVHDPTLDRETTGSGPVAAQGRDDLRALRLRDAAGQPTGHPVMLLEDLCTLLERSPAHPDALLQLDCKEDETVLDARTIETFARATGPVAGSLIVSSGSAGAIARLTEAVPGLRSGYDASDENRFKAALAAGGLQAFVDEAVAAAPAADMIYLYWEIVVQAADAGFDMIDAFHRHGKRVDAWTIRQVDAASVAVVERLLALKTDQVTTDDPVGLEAALNPSISHR
jgi:glycerophosphoryl diester phosphodiesterase